MNLAGGIFGCCVLNKLDISTNWLFRDPKALGCSDPERLNNLEPLVSMSNYYV